MKFSALLTIAGLGLTSVQAQMFDAYQIDTYNQDQIDPYAQDDFGVPNEPMAFVDFDAPADTLTGQDNGVQVDVDVPVGYPTEPQPDVDFQEPADNIKGEDFYVAGEDNLFAGVFGEELFDNAEDQFIVGDFILGEDTFGNDLDALGLGIGANFGEENLDQALFEAYKKVLSGEEGEEIFVLQNGEELFALQFGEEDLAENGEEQIFEKFIVDQGEELIALQVGEIGEEVLLTENGEEQIFEKLIGEEGEELFVISTSAKEEDYGLDYDNNEEQLVVPTVDFVPGEMEGFNGKKVTNGKGFKRADHLSNVFDGWNHVPEGKTKGFLSHLPKLSFGNNEVLN